MLLSNDWVNKEIEEDIKKYLYTNENEHTTIATIQNLWHTWKAVLREKFLATQAHLKKIFKILKRKKSNSASTRTRGTTKPKVSRGK